MIYMEKDPCHGGLGMRPLNTLSPIKGKLIVISNPFNPVMVLRKIKVI